MTQGRTPAQLFCLVVGAVLLLAGILGFFYNGSFTSDEADRDAVLGILDVNGFHNLVHIATGLVSLAAAGKAGAARTWSLLFGITYLIVAAWGFAIGSGENILGIIPVNTADNFLHLLLGLGGLGAYAASGADRTVPARA